MSTTLTFDELTLRIRAFIQLRIDRGEFTERSLARMLHVSQPHLHNMLKGVRRVGHSFSDIILARFNLTILDLISNEEIWDYLDQHSPGWLNLAEQRKPPTTETRRVTPTKRIDSRAPWRESGS